MNTEIKCYRCGKMNPPSESKKAKIIFRGYDHVARKQKVMSETLDFCKDGPCASHEQMSREG